MQLQVSGKQVETSEALNTYVEDRLTTGIEKYFSNPIDGHIVFSRDGHGFRADASVHVGHGIHVQSHASGNDVYAAFDSAAGRLEKQLRRYKRRLRNHHGKHKPSMDGIEAAKSYILASEEEDSEENDNPIVIAESKTDILTMTVGEAVMRLDLANDPVRLFRNSAHGVLNVVYRRADGNIGWIDPHEPSAEQ